MSLILYYILNDTKVNYIMTLTATFIQRIAFGLLLRLGA